MESPIRKEVMNFCIVVQKHINLLLLKKQFHSKKGKFYRQYKAGLEQLWMDYYWEKIMNGRGKFPRKGEEDYNFKVIPKPSLQSSITIQLKKKNGILSKTYPYVNH
jgi:hypothetical protein